MTKLSILFFAFLIAASAVFLETDVVWADVTPSIKLVKEANPSSLPAGGGQVVYKYRIMNLGNIELSNIALTDDKCGTINFLGGDANSNAKLDISEVWQYECSVNLTQTTVSTAKVTGQGGNFTVFDTTTMTVASSASAAPSINLAKTANPSSLPAGGGQVVYSYSIINSGNVALSNITLTDDKCSAIIFLGGDSNNNSMLEVSETWKYQCTVVLAQTVTNTGKASGQYGGNTYSDTEIATVVLQSGTTNASPSFKLTKIANPASLPVGGGTVTYTYYIANVGNSSLNNVTLSDDKCSAVNFTGGDTNGNNILEILETWTYQCTMNIIQTTTNFVTAHAFAGSIGVTDVASAVVVVGGVVPQKPPKTGSSGILADIINSFAGLSGLLGLASAGLYLKYARK